VAAAFRTETSIFFVLHGIKSRTETLWKAYYIRRVVAGFQKKAGQTRQRPTRPAKVRKGPIRSDECGPIKFEPRLEVLCSRKKHKRSRIEAQPPREL
jgi:hypothetical protein